MVLANINLDSNEAKAYIAIAVGVMGLGYLWLRPALRKRRDPLEKPPFSSLSQQRSSERLMQNLLVEMADMSRQISAQLDTRAEKLNVLIQEADEKIRQLRAQSSGIAGQENTAAISSDPPHAIELPHREIHGLADEGLTSAEIARRLNRPRGEVELILALRGTAQPAERRAAG